MLRENQRSEENERDGHREYEYGNRGEDEERASGYKNLRSEA